MSSDYTVLHTDGSMRVITHYESMTLTRVRVVDVLEVDLDHVQGAVAGLGQLLDGDELAPDGPGAPGRVDAFVVEGGIGGTVAEVISGDGPADVGGGGGVAVADAHFEGLGEAAPEDVQNVELLINGNPGQLSHTG